jgi:hypothetical protein
MDRADSDDVRRASATEWAVVVLSVDHASPVLLDSWDAPGCTKDYSGGS